MMFIFKIVLFIHITLYRLTNGRIGRRFNGGDILLLTTTGRKSGQTRTTPLMYIRDGDNYLITGSGGGSPKHPGWYWNATRGSHPVKIQVNELVTNVQVEEAASDQRDRLYQRFIDMNNQFAGYETKTSRKIPVLILKPTA